MILFDIDGTLIDGSEAHRKAFLHGFHRIYDIDPESNPEKYDGRTDSYIIKHKCEDEGLGTQQINKGLRQMMAEMCRIYKRLLIRYPVKVYPDTLATLKMLKKMGHKMRLVTGNLRCIAEAKLESVGLWEYFDGGAFGESSDDRADLVHSAMGKDRTIGFGDTPIDIAAYKEAGVFAVGVASGLTFTEKDLEDADLVIKSINPESVKEALSYL